jgi:hypothetical protein
VLGDVCAVTGRARAGVGGAADNVSALDDAASAERSGVGGATDSVSMISDTISVSGVSVAVAAASQLGTHPNRPSPTKNGRRVGHIH